MHPLLLIVAGAVTGSMVALTGVGGGSFLTPLLLFMGMPSGVLIGTDLVVATLTKTSATLGHYRHKTIMWDSVWRLAIGSVPAGWWASRIGIELPILAPLLGLMLLLTGISIVWRFYWPPKRIRPLRLPLPLVGVLIGTLVGLTSIGSGALLALLLVMMFPTISTRQIAGTDVAHAVLLSCIASLGHASRAAVDWGAVGWLLLGAVPAAYLAAHGGMRFSERVTRPLLGGLMGFAGVMLLLH